MKITPAGKIFRITEGTTTIILPERAVGRFLALVAADKKTNRKRRWYDKDDR